MRTARHLDEQLRSELERCSLAGLSAVRLTELTGIDRMTVYNRLREMVARGEVEKLPKAPAVGTTKAVTYFRLRAREEAVARARSEE